MPSSQFSQKQMDKAYILTLYQGVQSQGSKSEGGTIWVEKEQKANIRYSVPKQASHHIWRTSNWLLSPVGTSQMQDETTVPQNSYLGAGGVRNLYFDSFPSSASYGSKFEPWGRDAPTPEWVCMHTHAWLPVCLHPSTSPSHEKMYMFFFDNYTMTPMASLWPIPLASAYCPAPRREVGGFGWIGHWSIKHLEVVKWNKTQRWVVTMPKYQNPSFYSMPQLEPTLLF